MYKLRNISLFITILLLSTSCSKEDEINNAPEIGNLRINNSITFQSLRTDWTYQISFEASDDKNLKEYQLELLNPNGTRKALLLKEEKRGRKVFITNLFEIPNAIPGGDYILSLTLTDFNGATASLNREILLVSSSPSLMINTTLSSYNPGDHITFTGLVADKEDLEAFRIFVYKRNSNIFDTIGNVIYREFPGSNDTLCRLDSTYQIQLPTTLPMDRYRAAYWVIDHHGNTSAYSEELSINF